MFHCTRHEYVWLCREYGALCVCASSVCVRWTGYPSRRAMLQQLHGVSMYSHDEHHATTYSWSERGKEWTSGVVIPGSCFRLVTLRPVLSLIVLHPVTTLLSVLELSLFVYRFGLNHVVFLQFLSCSGVISTSVTCL